MLFGISNGLVATPPPPRPKQNPLRPGGLLILTIVIVIGILQIEKCREPEKVPIPDLPPDRLEKMLRELHELENAEQYALVATFSTFYPCYHCPNDTTIFLIRGETWRYGITRKGEKKRYGHLLKSMKLSYVPQYEGTWQDCIIEEKHKIYGYYYHPENTRRSFRLIRPPGNKQDR